jgi:choline dehydrogenase-like flavoprotein
VLGRVALAEELRRRERLPNVSVTLLPRLRRRLLRMPGRGGRYPRTEEHWSEQYVSGDESSGASRASSRHDAFTLLLNLEQLPHRENRVVLATRRDHLGLPAAELHWRWRKDDQLGLERTRAAVAREFEACGLGRVEIAALRPDPNAHHHAGTTRMSLDGDSGVVDPTGRVHGTGNLYACGASVFPTAGFANPTLTIVALALRLASHLGAEISRSTS